MAGIYGSHPEDRARERELDRYLDRCDEAAERIDRRAEEIYQDKLNSLPVTYRTSTFGTRILNLDDVMGDIFWGKTNEGVALACAIRDGNEEAAGKLLIKVVTNRLREVAEDQAEDEL